MVNDRRKIRTLSLLAWVAMTVCIMQVSAQERGYGAVGVHYMDGFGDDFVNHGVGAKLQLNFLHPLRLEGSVTAFIRKEDISMVETNFNLHWLAFLTDRFCIYPLAGASYQLTTLHEPYTQYGGLKTDHIVTSLSKWKLGANIGGGLDFYLTDVVIFNFEVKYKYLKYVNDVSRVNLSAGIAYLF
jgi:outer membrane protein X